MGENARLLKRRRVFRRSAFPSALQALRRAVRGNRRPRPPARRVRALARQSGPVHEVPGQAPQARDERGRDARHAALLRRPRLDGDGRTDAPGRVPRLPRSLLSAGLGSDRRVTTVSSTRSSATRSSRSSSAGSAGRTMRQPPSKPRSTWPSGRHAPTHAVRADSGGNRGPHGRGVRRAGPGRAARSRTSRRSAMS